MRYSKDFCYFFVEKKIISLMVFCFISVIFAESKFSPPRSFAKTDPKLFNDQLKVVMVSQRFTSQ